jgi:hypothetical protein
MLIQYVYCVPVQYNFPFSLSSPHYPSQSLEITILLSDKQFKTCICEREMQYLSFCVLHISFNMKPLSSIHFVQMEWCRPLWQNTKSVSVYTTLSLPIHLLKGTWADSMSQLL